LKANGSGCYCQCTYGTVQLSKEAPPEDIFEMPEGAQIAPRQKVNQD
jgi:hypothetical protein